MGFYEEKSLLELGTTQELEILREANVFATKL
jgi:hypothetical protein